MTIAHWNNIVDMLNGHWQMEVMKSFIFDQYDYMNGNENDWNLNKHGYIDDACVNTMEYEDIRKIVDAYGVFEVMDYVKESGENDVTYLTADYYNMNERYRTLFYWILQQYITEIKERDYQHLYFGIHSNEASDADTDEEN